LKIEVYLEIGAWGILSRLMVRLRKRDCVERESTVARRGSQSSPTVRPVAEHGVEIISDCSAGKNPRSNFQINLKSQKSHVQTVDGKWGSSPPQIAATGDRRPGTLKFEN
jgi:hypothetical protein